MPDPASKIVTLNGDTVLLVKLQGSSPTGKWVVDINVTPEQVGGGGCGNQAVCSKTQCTLTIVEA
jgi:hypothetical protein